MGYGYECQETCGSVIFSYPLFPHGARYHIAHDFVLGAFIFEVKIGIAGDNGCLTQRNFNALWGALLLKGARLSRFPCFAFLWMSSSLWIIWPEIAWRFRNLWKPDPVWFAGRCLVFLVTYSNQVVVDFRTCPSSRLVLLNLGCSIFCYG